MGSTNTTSNLHLSSWTETDKPQRIDFVNDNNIIDSVLGNHIADSTVHMTAEEKQQLKTQIVTVPYYGSGHNSQEISLTFTPKVVIAYCFGEPLCKINADQVNLVYSGMATSHGSTGGITLNGTVVTVSQTPSIANPSAGECSYNLNERNKRYALILVQTIPTGNT